MKKNSGITLIALVITIVVLLILAGISISAVFGRNGIIDKANEAKYLTKLREYEEKVTLIVASEKTLKVTENKEERLIKLVYNKLEEQDWVGMLFVKEQDDELEEDEIKVITTDNFRIVAKIDDDGKVTFIEEESGIEDGEPYPKIVLEQIPLEGNEGEKVKVKVKASVEEKGKTKKIAKIELIKEDTVLAERTYNNLDVEDIFEIETNGIYTFKATTDQEKSRSKKLEINIEETDSRIEIDQDIKTPRNTIETGIKNGIETGPIQVTIKYDDNELQKQYKKQNDTEWTTVDTATTTINITENTTILARYYNGINELKLTEYKVENVDNVAPKITSKDATISNRIITATMSGTDESGILRYEYSFDGENYQTNNKVTLTKGGDISVYFKAIDIAGNETIETIEVPIPTIKFTNGYSINSSKGESTSTGNGSTSRYIESEANIPKNVTITITTFSGGNCNICSPYGSAYVYFANKKIISRTERGSSQEQYTTTEAGILKLSASGQSHIHGSSRKWFSSC